MPALHSLFRGPGLALAAMLLVASSRLTAASLEERIGELAAATRASCGHREMLPRHDALHGLDSTVR